MSLILDLYLNQFFIFVMILARVSGLVITAPILGARSVPIVSQGEIMVFGDREGTKIVIGGREVLGVFVDGVRLLQLHELRDQLPGPSCAD